MLRELELGPAHRAGERERLERILGHTAISRRCAGGWCDALRDGSMPLDRPGLAEHLRATVVNQVAIDQPRYSGYRTAIDAGR